MIRINCETECWPQLSGMWSEKTGTHCQTGTRARVTWQSAECGAETEEAGGGGEGDEVQHGDGGLGDGDRRCQDVAWGLVDGHCDERSCGVSTHS